MTQDGKTAKEDQCTSEAGWSKIDVDQEWKVKYLFFCTMMELAFHLPL